MIIHHDGVPLRELQDQRRDAQQEPDRNEYVWLNTQGQMLRFDRATQAWTMTRFLSKAGTWVSTASARTALEASGKQAMVLIVQHQARKWLLETLLAAIARRQGCEP